MKKIIILLTLAMGFLNTNSASANGRSTFHYTYMGSGVGNYSLVSCDYAESQVQSLIELFGAKDINVYCSGGISTSGYNTPVSLTAEYTAPELGTNPVTVTKVFESDHWNPVCDFNVDMISQVVSNFSNVKVLKGGRFCMSPEDNFTFKFEIQLPQ